MRPLLLCALAAACHPPAADYKPDLPPGAVRYEPATVTQSLSRLAAYPNAPLALDTRRVLPVKIRQLPDADWHQSGGMKGIDGVTSDKYRSGGKAVHKWSPFEVEFSLPSGGAGKITEMGIGRTYPDGVRFDDVLSYKGVVFEHRAREKQNGQWSNTTLYKNPAAYPPGYAGLKATCASCHNKAGTGGYDKGLVPGGDTVFSDPLDWSVVPRGVIVK